MAVTLNPGMCRHLVELQKPIEGGVRSGKGHKDLKYETVCEAYVSIETESQRENLDDQVRVQSTHAFRTWWQPGIAEDWRIRFGSRLFHIDGVENVEEQNAVLIIKATEQR